jgi:hypothetical protein
MVVIRTSHKGAAAQVAQPQEEALGKEAQPQEEVQGKEAQPQEEAPGKEAQPGRLAAQDRVVRPGRLAVQAQVDLQDWFPQSAPSSGLWIFPMSVPARATLPRRRRRCPGA